MGPAGSSTAQQVLAGPGHPPDLLPVPFASSVLALEPRHFGALSGLGLIALAIGEPEQALEAFDTALMIHPNMAGADTHIRALREKLKGRGI